MKTINKEKRTFIIESSEELLNAIRRYVAQIPVMAIDEVEISMNDSPLYDETLAHRLGLVPLKSKGLVNEKTTSKLKLSSKKEGYVYSKELKGDIEVIYDNIPLTILKEGQELKISATVRGGKGENHAKFSPGMIFYRNTFDIKIDKDCPVEIVEFCPQKILKVKENKVIVEDPVKCDGCELCLEKCPKKEKEYIKIIPSKDLSITIESFGQLEPSEIFKKSIDILKKDLNSVLKAIK